MNNKPKYLFRGIKLKYELLQQLPLYGIEIKPHYTPLFNEEKRETSKDGNEYGIYMTDNITMAREAYSKVEINDGTIIGKDLKLVIADRMTLLTIPAVGIIYKIDTDGLDIHKPWISNQLIGHYNNGYEGHEWITDKISPNNYTIIEATIGPDLLHDAEKISISNIVEDSKKIRGIVEKRKRQLEALERELKKLSPLKRTLLTKKDIQLYKDIFGDNGVAYINTDNIQTNTALDYIMYLLSVFYKSNTQKLDYKALNYIENLKSRLKETDDVNTLIELINIDIINSTNKNKEIFIKVLNALKNKITNKQEQQPNQRKEELIEFNHERLKLSLEELKEIGINLEDIFTEPIKEELEKQKIETTDFTERRM